MIADGIKKYTVVFCSLVTVVDTTLKKVTIAHSQSRQLSIQALPLIHKNDKNFCDYQVYFTRWRGYKCLIVSRLGISP